MWAFQDRRFKECLAVTKDVAFSHSLPGATGYPLLKIRENIKKMVAILEHETPDMKERWLGHQSIPPRVLGPKQYLVSLPTQQAKPRVTSKPMPAACSSSRLVPPEA